MAYKEAKKVGFGSIPFAVQDLMVICEMDNLILSRYLVVANIELQIEMDNMLTLTVGAAAKPLMFLVF